MHAGKVSYNILKRSVLKSVTPRREEVLLGAGIGYDNSVISCKEDGVFVMSTNPVIMEGKEAPILCMNRVLNDLACGGAEPLAIMPTILFPKISEENLIRTWMKAMDRICKERQIEIIGCHTAVSGAIKKPILSITAIGKRNEKKWERTRPNQDIIVTKFIGLEGCGLLAIKKEEELATRYSHDFLNSAKKFLDYLSIIPEAAVAGRYGATAMHNVSEGGIFGALWEMMDGAGTGMEIDLKSIPIRQETVEICEFFDLNPYQLLSGGALLITADKGQELVKELQKEGIPATIIGKTTAGKDRVIRNEEEERFLDLPKMDEIFKTGLM